VGHTDPPCGTAAEGRNGACESIVSVFAWFLFFVGGVDVLLLLFFVCVCAFNENGRGEAVQQRLAPPAVWRCSCFFPFLRPCCRRGSTPGARGRVGH